MPTLRAFARTSLALLAIAGSAHAAAILSLSDDFIFFDNIPPGSVNVPAKTFRINNTGDAAGPYTTQIAFVGPAWFTLSPTSGTVNAGSFATLSVRPNNNLPNGNYEATITVRTTGNVVVDTIDIFLSVSGGLLVVAPQQVSLNIPFGSTNAQGNVTATIQGGSATIIATPSGGAWLTVSPAQSGEGASQQTFTITATKSQITGSSASGAVQIRCEGGSPCAPQIVSVNVTVAPDVVLNTPASLAVEAVSGANPLTRMVAVGSSTGAVLAYTISIVQGTGWLSAASSSNSTQTPVTVTIDPRSLAQGQYSGQIRLTPSNGSPAVNINVELNVLSGGLTLSASSIAFSTPSAGNCGRQTISVSSGGAGVTYTVRPTVVTPAGGTWLTTTPEQGIAPGSFTAICDARNLSAGNYTGSVTLTGSAPGTQPIVVPVTLTVGGPPIAIVSAASGDPRLAGAMIASIYGVDLSTATEVATTTPLPQTLGGRSVSVRDANGITRNSSMFFVSPGQINFEIPGATIAGDAVVTVLNGSVPVAAANVAISKVAPGLFKQLNDIAAAGAARYFPDGTSEPVETVTCGATSCSAVPIDVTRGTVFLSLYGTGIRNVGSLEQVSCTVGGQPAPVTYAGDQLTYPGLDQVNVQLPASLAGSGEVELQLVVEGVPSAKVKIAIQ